MSAKNPHLVLLPISPMHGLDNYLRNNEDVDEYLTLMMAKSSQYKAGESERAIYQKMHSLKKINVALSALYNFNS